MPVVEIRSSNLARILQTLNQAAAKRQTCVSIAESGNKTTLTLRTLPPDEPPRLWYAVPWLHFNQPKGWDYVGHTNRFAFYSRPLPAGTTAETRRGGSYPELAAWLGEMAAKGTHLVAAYGDTYYFVPAAPAAVRYTVGDLGLNSRAFTADRRELTAQCNATEPDAAGWYFVTYSDTLAIFADRPGLAPAGKEIPVPPELCAVMVRPSWKWEIRMYVPLLLCFLYPVVFATVVLIFLKMFSLLPLFLALSSLPWLGLGGAALHHRRQAQTLADSLVDPSLYPRAFKRPLGRRPRPYIPESRDIHKRFKPGTVVFLLILAAWAIWFSVWVLTRG